MKDLFLYVDGKSDSVECGSVFVCGRAISVAGGAVPKTGEAVAVSQLRQ
jgi:hypothetical protein